MSTFCFEYLSKMWLYHNLIIFSIRSYSCFFSIIDICNHRIKYMYLYSEKSVVVGFNNYW